MDDPDYFEKPYFDGKGLAEKELIQSPENNPFTQVPSEQSE